MPAYSAEWIFTGDGRVLYEHAIEFDEQGIVLNLRKRRAGDPLLAGALCPGFVNCHSHLEYSYLKGRLPEDTGLDRFIIKLEEAITDFSLDEAKQAATDALKEMKKNGIVALADLVNSDLTYMIKGKSDLLLHYFIEVYGSDPSDAIRKINEAEELKQKFKGSITPHAPYSVSSLLMDLLGRKAIENGSLLSIHHQENEDENAFFLMKSGPVVSRMQRLGVDISRFNAIGTRASQALTQMLPADIPMMFVHNTVARKEDVEIILSHFQKTYWCLCPAANHYIERKLPDLPMLLDMSCKIVLGTDSYASNKELSILREMQILSLAFDIPAEELVKWATLNGAEALNMDDEIGSFSKGKKPGILQLYPLGEEGEIIPECKVNRII